MLIKGFLFLFIFQALGELLVRWFNLIIPGSVIGLLLLFIYLLFMPTPEPLQKVADGLVRSLSLFFLPAGVGLFFLPENILSQWPALLAAMVLGTAVALFICALILRWISRP
ncbi:CidA/LrgA family protein [Sessilibacter sp. MAH2]